MRVDWSAKHYMLLMHFLCRLTFKFRTWCISVEKEVGDIDLPRMSDLCFELDRRTLYQPHIPAPAYFYLGTPAPISLLNTIPSAAPSPSPAAPHTPIGYRSLWTPTVDFLLLLCIGILSCISTCISTRETLLALDNISVMCLAWSMCRSFSVKCSKHRYRGPHVHISENELKYSLSFSNRWCQTHTTPPHTTPKYCTPPP